MSGSGADAATRATVAAYDAHAADYRDAAPALTGVVRERLDDLAQRLGAGARVLEIGTASGRDAAHLESRGLAVRRTDISPGFVDLLRAGGQEADVLDPLRDDLDDPGRPGTAYDGVWADACLLHVARTDLPVVLARLAGATRVGGMLGLSLKEGDGEDWSTHGAVAAPRRFVYWREAPLRVVLEAAGWSVRELTAGDGLREERWLTVSAARRP